MSTASAGPGLAGGSGRRLPRWRRSVPVRPIAECPHFHAATDTASGLGRRRADRYAAGQVRAVHATGAVGGSGCRLRAGRTGAEPPAPVQHGPEPAGGGGARRRGEAPTRDAAVGTHPRMGEGSGPRPPAHQRAGGDDARDARAPRSARESPEGSSEPARYRRKKPSPWGTKCLYPHSHPGISKTCGQRARLSEGAAPVGDPHRPGRGAGDPFRREGALMAHLNCSGSIAGE